MSKHFIGPKIKSIYHAFIIFSIKISSNLSAEVVVECPWVKMFKSRAVLTRVGCIQLMRQGMVYSPASEFMIKDQERPIFTWSSKPEIRLDVGLPMIRNPETKNVQLNCSRRAKIHQLLLAKTLQLFVRHTWFIDFWYHVNCLWLIEWLDHRLYIWHRFYKTIANHVPDERTCQFATRLRWG